MIPEEAITNSENVEEQKEAEPENELRYQKLMRLMMNRNTLSMFRVPVVGFAQLQVGLLNL